MRRARRSDCRGTTVLDAITYDMITLVGPQLGDQTRLGRTERHTQGSTWVPEDRYKLVVTVSTQQSI